MTDLTNQESDFEVSIINNRPIGGQQVGTHICPVKVLHKPTGIYAVCDAQRSQHRNRTIAMRMVEYGLAEMGVPVRNEYRDTNAK